MVELQKNSAAYVEKPNIINICVLAARPKTLSISAVPIITGTILSLDKAVHMKWALACLSLICAFLIQIGINVVNDAMDFKKGADTHERIGPLRITQAGFLSFRQVMAGGLACFACALLMGLPLIWAGGWPLALALFLSVIFGYFYTAGPKPLAYYGLGEVFVMIFFGYVITCSAFFLQTGFVDSTCLLAATQIGLLAAVPLVINNTRDITGDRQVNKWTLSARFGVAFSRVEIIVLTAIAYLLGVLWIYKGFPWAALFPLIALPFIFKNVKAIYINDPSPTYNLFLARSAKGQLLFGLLLCLGFLLSL